MLAEGTLPAVLGLSRRTPADKAQANKADQDSHRRLKELSVSLALAANHS